MARLKTARQAVTASLTCALIRRIAKIAELTMIISVLEALIALTAGQIRD